MRTKRKQHGFTLVELMVVVAITGLLVALAIPNFLKTREYAQKNVCIENLAQIESAKQIFGVEKGKQSGDVVTDSDLFGSSLYMKKKPQCPAGGDYDLGTIGGNATCPHAVTMGHVLE